VDVKKSKQNIVRQLSDIRPAQPTGFLRQPQSSPIQQSAYYQQEIIRPQNIMQLGASQSSTAVPYFPQSTYVLPPRKPLPQEETIPEEIVPEQAARALPFQTAKRKFLPVSPTKVPRVAVKKKVAPEEHYADLLQTAKQRIASSYFAFVSTIGPLFQKRFAYATLAIGALGIVAIGSSYLFSKGMKMKGEVLGVSQDGYASLDAATQNIKDRHFDKSAVDFAKAEQSFSEAAKSFDEWNVTLVDLSQFFPLMSKLSSGKNAVEAGRHIALAGQNLNGALAVLSSVKNPLDTKSNVSLLGVFQETEKSVAKTKDELVLANDALDKVNVDDLPEDKRTRFVQVKMQLPVMIEMMNGFADSSHIFSELLGGNGPRKYLFLFQNNHEMRATGGFIGSYGLLDIANGRVRKFFVDGIFNPDGQLKENIVPPKPIQKMSAAWSLHDSNWFPDFPSSAEKAVSFYEKTGGPTVDGVITLTPTVMQKLLQVTGPIRMDAYNKTLDADNFTEEVQQEVEVDYDKSNNKPKQILSDLAPILLDKLFNVSDTKQALATAQALEEGLGEKHILLYSRDTDIEKIIDDAGWSGKILDAQKDYVSVINTNINGYKTDGVIDESIDHQAAIQDDGSVIDTVTVTRKHNGGHEDKDWWNKVNADYMRVYVPQGSKLLDAQGQTREVDESPLDYDKLGFKRDKDVDQEEKSIVIDPQTGTQIYDEAGKTVFANWTYVSPQETVVITYRYLLPFKIQPELQEKGGFDSYALTLEKQSGSFGSHLVSSLSFPSRMKLVWQSSQNLLPYDGGLRLEGDLKRDQFMGVVFGR
jgi:hypothetical protein